MNQTPTNQVPVSQVPMNYIPMNQMPMYQVPVNQFPTNQGIGLAQGTSGLRVNGFYGGPGNENRFVTPAVRMPTTDQQGLGQIQRGPSEYRAADTPMFPNNPLKPPPMTGQGTPPQYLVVQDPEPRAKGLFDESERRRQHMIAKTDRRVKHAERELQSYQESGMASQRHQHRVQDRIPLLYRQRAERARPARDEPAFRSSPMPPPSSEALHMGFDGTGEQRQQELERGHSEARSRDQSYMEERREPRG